MSVSCVWRSIAVMLLCMAAWASPCLAQPTNGEVTIELESFGVGGQARPGEWTGVRFALTDTASTQREVLLRVTCNDADRDRVPFERAVTLNPNVRQSVWLYLRLPGWMNSNQVILVEVYEALEQTGGDATTTVAGRAIGQVRFNIPSLLNRGDGLFGVVGGRAMGLDEFMRTLPNDPQTAVRSHERTEVVIGLKPEDIPDRWHGLMPYSTLIWNDAPPSRLGLERAQAIRTWVQRGGHLIVVLPRAGQSWTDEVNNPLFDITPNVSADRMEDVDLFPIWQALERPAARKPGDPDAPPRPSITPPKKQIVHYLRPRADASPDQAIPVLVDPSNAMLVTRRLVGTGAVTLIGLDLSHSDMNKLGLPDAEVFWHRILGTRGEFLDAKELLDLANGTTLRANREPVTVDRGVSTEIAKTGRAAAGVMIGFILFIAYWVVAGPGGFGLLKWRSQTKHAWVAFVAVAGIFTAIAWGGANFLRTRTSEASHLSIIQHVYGQPVQRARGWFNVLVPFYGDALLEVGQGDGKQDTDQLISPWEPTGANGPDAGFPDSRAYQLRTASPNQLLAPARATVKHFQADWAGSPVWKMPRPWAPSDQTEPGEITLLPVPTGTDQPQMTGSLVHDLPAPLQNTVLMIVRGQRSLLGQSGANSIANTVAFKLASPWEPGQPLDLNQVTRKSAGPAYLETLLDDLVPDGDDLTLSGGRLTDRIEALVFFSQLRPPEFESNNKSHSTLSARRELTHGWDLGRWFTQPCLIVVGMVGTRDGQDPSPIPLRVGTSPTNLKAISTTGQTIVMWVYPLPPAPPSFPKPDPADASNLPISPLDFTPESR